LWLAAKEKNMNWKFWAPKTPATPVPEPKVYELTPKIKTQELLGTGDVPLLVPAASGVLLKRMKWVVCRGRIGIFWDLDSSGNCTIHYTDAAGATVEVSKARVSELRLARYAEIPGPRRVGLSQVQAAALGYF